MMPIERIDPDLKRLVGHYWEQQPRITFLDVVQLA